LTTTELGDVVRIVAGEEAPSVIEAQ